MIIYNYKTGAKSTKVIYQEIYVCDFYANSIHFLSLRSTMIYYML
jgi:hypothetical protein